MVSFSTVISQLRSSWRQKLRQGVTCGAMALGVWATVPAAEAQQLTQADVQQIIAQAVNEAIARNRQATIAVTDRVGNVLGIFQMTNAGGFTITSGRGITNSGLEGIALPAAASRAAAISKAITGAYLSSNGNAFTSRTANQIVQEHFNPGELGQPSGPLFGVQISQLPCSDLSMRFVNGSINQNIGPKRSPVGLSADPGGLPLYKNGIAAGGIGVLSDGIYGLDLVITDTDTDDDELIAFAGTVGFQPPNDIRANRITVIGKTLRYTDRGVESLAADPTVANFAAINGTQGNVVALPGYNIGNIIDGQIFGQAGSGIRADTSGAFGTRPAFILVDGNNNPRFAPRAGTDGGLSAAEVLELLRQGLGVALDGRAQIRRPLDSFIQVTVSIVDTNGAILGIARTPDGPIFGTDVSLQKSRTAAFFSNPNAGDDLLAETSSKDIAQYVTAARALLGPTALADGVAFADRSGGNLARPFFPDGNNNNFNGPFSLPFLQWSPFSTGLQLDLVFDDIIGHVNFLLGVNPTDVPARCTRLPLRAQTGASRIPNGIQIFPGSVPVYKNGLLVGGFGVSGDGIDQDDMISFLGTHRAGEILANGTGNAPQNVRADKLAPNGVRLRYVNCPFKPFVGNTIQDPCNGK